MDKTEAEALYRRILEVLRREFPGLNAAPQDMSRITEVLHKEFPELKIAKLDIGPMGIGMFVAPAEEEKQDKEEKDSPTKGVGLGKLPTGKAYF